MQPIRWGGNYSFLQKFIAIFVSSCLLISQSLYAGTEARSQKSEVRKQNSENEKDSSLTSDFRLLASRLNVPASLGKIESTHVSGDKTIIYIQDAHDSLEAQLHIARLIRHFVKTENVKTVFEEGYEGPVPTDDFFGFIKDPSLKQKVSYFLLDKLRIGGAEYAHINRKRMANSVERIADKKKQGTKTSVPSAIRHPPYADFKLIGADQISLHLKSIRWYRKMAHRQEETARDLEAIQKEIEKLAKREFPKELKEWMKWKERFDAQQMSLLDYVKRMMSISSLRGHVGPEAISEPRLLRGSTMLTILSLSKDFARNDITTYPRLSLLLLADRTQEREVIEKARAIDAKGLVAEIDALENAFADHFLTDKTNQEIFQYHKGLLLLSRLKDMKLSAEEYEGLKKLHEVTGGYTKLQEVAQPHVTSCNVLVASCNFTQGIASFISKNTQHSLVLSKRWELLIQNAIQFYETARQRDRSLEARLEKFIQNPDEKVAVLVYGGFHKNSIQEILTRHQLSHVIVTPKISSLSARHQAYYKKLMTRGYHSFEVPLLLAKAARAKPTFVLPRGRDEVKAVYQSFLRNLASKTQGDLFRAVEDDLEQGGDVVVRDPWYVDRFARSEVRPIGSAEVTIKQIELGSLSKKDRRRLLEEMKQVNRDSGWGFSEVNKYFETVQDPKWVSGNRDFIALAFDQGNQLIGHAWLFEKDKENAEFYVLSIRKAWQRQKIAPRLFGWLLEQTRKDGIKILEAEMDLSNNSSIRFMNSWPQENGLEVLSVEAQGEFDVSKRREMKKESSLIDFVENIRQDFGPGSLKIIMRDHRSEMRNQSIEGVVREWIEGLPSKEASKYEKIWRNFSENQEFEKALLNNDDQKVVSILKSKADEKRETVQIFWWHDYLLTVIWMFFAVRLIMGFHLTLEGIISFFVAGTGAILWFHHRKTMEEAGRIDELRKVIHQKFSRPARSETRTSQSTGFLHHFRAESVIATYDNVYLSHPLAGSYRPRLWEKEPRALNPYQDQYHAEYLEKIQLAVQFLRSRADQLSDFDLLERVQRLESSTSLIGLDMPTHLLFFDPRARRSVVYHIDAQRSVVYFSLPFLHSIEKGTKGIQELAIYLDRGQRFIDAYQFYQDAKRPSFSYRHLKQIERQFEKEDRKIVGNSLSELPLHLAKLKEEDQKILLEVVSPEMEKLRNEISESEEKINIRRSQKDFDLKEDYWHLSKLFGRLAHLHENTGRYEQADQYYLDQVDVLHDLQRSDSGQLPVVKQFDIVLLLLLAGLYDNFLKELKVLLTGEGFPEKFEGKHEGGRPLEKSHLSYIISGIQSGLLEQYLAILKNHSEMVPKTEHQKIQSVTKKVKQLFAEFEASNQIAFQSLNRSEVRTAVLVFKSPTGNKIDLENLGMSENHFSREIQYQKFLNREQRLDLSPLPDSAFFRPVLEEAILNALNGSKDDAFNPDPSVQVRLDSYPQGIFKLTAEQNHIRESDWVKLKEKKERFDREGVASLTAEHEQALKTMTYFPQGSGFYNIGKLMLETGVLLIFSRDVQTGLLKTELFFHVSRSEARSSKEVDELIRELVKIIKEYKALEDFQTELKTKMKKRADRAAKLKLELELASGRRPRVSAINIKPKPLEGVISQAKRFLRRSEARAEKKEELVMEKEFLLKKGEQLLIRLSDEPFEGTFALPYAILEINHFIRGAEVVSMKIKLPVVEIAARISNRAGNIVPFDSHQPFIFNAGTEMILLSREIESEEDNLSATEIYVKMLERTDNSIKLKINSRIPAEIVSARTKLAHEKRKATLGRILPFNASAFKYTSFTLNSIVSKTDKTQVFHRGPDGLFSPVKRRSPPRSEMRLPAGPSGFADEASEAGEDQITEDRNQRSEALSPDFRSLTSNLFKMIENAKVKETIFMKAEDLGKLSAAQQEELLKTLYMNRSELKLIVYETQEGFKTNPTLDSILKLENVVHASAGADAAYKKYALPKTLNIHLSKEGSQDPRQGFGAEALSHLKFFKPLQDEIGVIASTLLFAQKGFRTGEGFTEKDGFIIPTKELLAAISQQYLAQLVFAIAA